MHLTPDAARWFDSLARPVYNSRHVLRSTINAARHTGSIAMKKPFLVLLLLSSLLFACTPDIPQLPPAEVISRAGDAMLAAPSFHFKIDLSGERVVLNELTQLVLRSAEGDFARPDKMGVHLKVLASVAAAELDMIALGNEQYLTNVLTKQWEVLPPEFGFNPAIMFDPKIGLEQLLQSGLDNPHWIGVETLDGKNIWHVQGDIDGARVQGMSGGLISSGPADVDLWIEPNSFLPRKAVIVDKNSNPDKPTTWTMMFSSFGKDVNITAPELK
jgi:lipoprotein LprG